MYGAQQMSDLWNEHPPNTGFLTTSELVHFLRVGSRVSEGLSDWDREFCRSCLQRIKCHTGLTDAQCRVLDRGLLKKLWDADPALWPDLGADEVVMRIWRKPPSWKLAPFTYVEVLEQKENG